MKKLFSLIVAVALVLSLAACDSVLVDLETPKSSELSAQYDFYSDSMNTIRNRMGITPEQADEVFIALIESGLDGKVTLVTKNDNGYKVSWGANSLEVAMNEDGTVSEISNGKDVIFPEYKQYNFLLDCKVKTADVISGSGDAIGQYAYISVLKSQLKDLTEENFKEFIKTVIESDEYKGFNYFLIKCDDGTGIHYSGNDLILMYGKINSDNMIEHTELFLVLDDNGHYQEKLPESEE